VLWLLFFDTPDRHRALDPAERQMIVEGQERHLAGGARPSPADILRQRNFWGIALPRFLADPTWGTLTFWVPLYLSQVRHFDLKQIAMFAWMPFLAADIGCFAGGTICLFLQRRGVSLINARRSAFTVGAVMMMGMGFVGVVESPYTAIALLSLGGFAHQTLSVTVITMSSDLFKRSEVATVAGMAGTCGNAGLLLFSLMIGGSWPRRLHAVLRRARRPRPRGRGRALDAGAGASDRRPEAAVPQCSAPSSATRSCAGSTRTRRSCASTTTTTSPPRRSSGSPESRSTTRATWCTGAS
jgi:hypothetical protein